MKRMLGIIAAIVAVMVMALPLAACGADTSKTQSELDLLKETIEELTDRLDDLTTENGELTDKNAELTDRLDDLATANGELADKNEELSDRIDALNVFTTDKAEYNEHETMTIYFRNIPVLKICIDFNSASGTALRGGGAMNHTLLITSLFSDIYASAIVDTSFAVSNAGTFVRESSAGSRVLQHNKETGVSGQFNCSYEAYNASTWFDIVICVPGTPFELARFKNVSHS